MRLCAKESRFVRKGTGHSWLVPALKGWAKSRTQAQSEYCFLTLFTMKHKGKTESLPMCANEAAGSQGMQASGEDLSQYTYHPPTS